jgi:hypothetical protein
MASRLERLDERYGTHHRDRQEFVFGADERAGLIADLVGGPGLDVLDIACRTGPLTQNVKIGFAVGRYLRWNSRLMARVQVFSAQNPR